MHFGMVGLEAQRLIEVRQRVLASVEPVVGHTEIVERHDAVRPDSEGLLVVRDGLVMTIERPQHIAAIA